MIKSDPSLEPDWDEDNFDHIARHGLRPEQIEEVYYGDGPYPPLALKNSKRAGFNPRGGAWSGTRDSFPCPFSQMLSIKT